MVRLSFFGYITPNKLPINWYHRLTMDQALALEIMLEGHSVLLTGAAGAGKTHVLNQFIRESRRQGKAVAVTATTGLAATHLNGNTIHAWSGIGIHDVLPGDFHERLSQSRKDQIAKADILVIDEISMLHDYRLDMIDEIVRRVRMNDTPFGGLQVVLCGDFFQLPPVERGHQSRARFVVRSNAWAELSPVICYLNEQHRQDDDMYLDILNSMRANDLRRRHVEALMGRQQPFDPFEEVTELHTTNVDVDAINRQRLEALPGKSHYFGMETSGKANYVETLKKSCLAHEQLELKVGALVMCIRNNPEKKYVNGSLGIVTGFEPIGGYPLVELRNGREIIVSPETWELRDGDTKRASIVQIPLRLAWAITVHKSQGMTLDAARIDLRKAFVEGMGYVALSRVRSLKTLSLAGINKMALQVSPDALAIHLDLLTRSRVAADEYEPLRENAAKRQARKDVPVTGINWSTRLEKMRGQYPNAYKPWNKKDDEKLVTMFTTGKKIPVKDLSETFGRHPGSIRARIKKHFGEDALETHKSK